MLIIKYTDQIFSSQKTRSTAWGTSTTSHPMYSLYPAGSAAACWQNRVSSRSHTSNSPSSLANCGGTMEAPNSRRPALKTISTSFTVIPATLGMTIPLARAALAIPTYLSISYWRPACISCCETPRVVEQSFHVPRFAVSIFPLIAPLSELRTAWALTPSMVAPRAKSPLQPNWTFPLRVTPWPSGAIDEVDGVSAKLAVILTGVLFPYFQTN